MSKHVGFDPGTSNLVLAFEGSDGVNYVTERNAFNLITPVTPIHKNMLVKGLESNKAKWIEIDNQICVVGQHAIDLANSGSGEVLRPMATGKINPAEKKARRILRFLISKMAEPYIEKGTKIVYSCTGNAVDLPSDKIFDTGAHQDFITGIFEELGATVTTIDEAEAIAYSELLDNGLTGFTMSQGAGTFSSGVFLNGQPITTFCTSRAGDYIDLYTSQADVDWTPSLVQAEKEKTDLLNPENEMQETIVGYYKRLYKYSLQNIAKGLDASKIQRFKQPIEMVVSGGTASIKGAIDILADVLNSIDFPLNINRIRLAENPLYTTASGCLVAATL